MSSRFHSPTEAGISILRQAVHATSPKRSLWGTRNSWIASAQPSPVLSDLIERGLLVPGHPLGGGTLQYRATVDGMRAAGLGPKAIERCLNL